MSTQDSNWQRVRSYLKAVPVDLLAILGVLAALTSTHALVPDGPIWTFLLGGLFLVFVPGYALLAVIFPRNAHTERASSVADLPGVSVEDGIGFPERVALSFGMSVTLIPILALVLAAVGLPFTAATVGGILAATIVGSVLLAMYRRLRVPVEERFRLPLGQWASETRTFLFGGSWTDSIVNVVLVVCVLVGLSAAAYAFAVPQPDAQFTSFALLTRTPNGEYVSSNYPTNFTQGQPQELVVSVTNNRRKTTHYTVVAELQTVRTNRDDRLQVLSERKQRQFAITLDPNETWRRPHDITPQRAGKNLRLVYYLYRGNAPPNPSAETADKRLQLWINVSARVPQNRTTGPQGQNNGTATATSGRR